MIHVYQQKHIFQGDFYIGFFNAPAGVIHLKTKHEAAKQAVQMFFGGKFGFVPRIVVTDEEPERPVVLLALPPFILKQIEPGLGDRTPAVEAWIRANHPPEQIVARYGQDETADETTDKPKTVRTRKNEQRANTDANADPGT
jgi:hypothetical protein